MTPEKYLIASGRTDLQEIQRENFILRVGESHEIVDLLHASIGVCTEAGELLDVMKKHLAYGKELDKVNIAEEAGDLLWYLAIIFRRFNMSFEDVMEMNINKLQKRFPEKFTEEQAIQRDLFTERAQLEADSQHLVGE